MKVILKLAALAIDVASWLYPLALAGFAGFLTASFTSTILTAIAPSTLIAILPLLYLLWLFIFICLGVLGTTLIFLSFKKPRKLETDLTFPSTKEVWRFLDASRVITLYRFGLLMQRLPGLNYSMLTPIIFQWMNLLVLRAYSPSVHIGKGSLIASRPQDPDLTYIGNHVVIGSGCSIVAHALNTAAGKFKFASEPIEIADYCTIGGDVRLGMGVKVARGAVIEVGSNVLPYTRIGSGEVWGGNPAAFLRMVNQDHHDLQPLPNSQKQDVQKTDLTASTAAIASINESDVNGIIARAVRLRPEEITETTSSLTCPEWDSLAQMQIAAALYDRFGITIPPKDIFQLDSRQSIQRMIAAYGDRPSNSQAAVPVVTPSIQFNLPTDPELLPLYDPELVTRTLAQRYQTLRTVESRSVLIAATFTVQPLGSTLELWCRAFQIPSHVDFLEFDQVEQTLLAEQSNFLANSEGLNVVILRPEDLISESDPSGMSRGQQLLEAIKFYASRQKGLVVSNLPPAISSFYSGAATKVAKLRFWWQEQLEQIEGITILDFASVLDAIGHQQAGDASLEVVTRAPYALSVYQRLGIAIARSARQTFLPAKKVLALDCDQTLWGGRIGEDGIDGLALSDDYPGYSFRLFQKAILALKKQGILLVLVSKNESSDVWQVFDQHPGMVLRRSDIAGARINWQPKSANLHELAKELNLGLDSFIFVDDSPAERLEVEMNVPEVTVLPLPEDPARYVETLTKLWCFDAVNVTAEDEMRTQFMLQEQQRQMYQKEAIDLDSYLQSLNLTIEVRFATARDLPRVAQLTQKTNQFNLSLIRRSLAEIQVIQNTASILILTVKDRFGDYGLVGVAILQPDNDILRLDTFLMSCRALGRGAEEAFLVTILEFAYQRGLGKVVAPYQPGSRNGQMKNFLLKVGFEQHSPNLFVMEVNQMPEKPQHVTAVGYCSTWLDGKRKDF
jgi:FkbH-like protein